MLASILHRVCLGTCAALLIHSALAADAPVPASSITLQDAVNRSLERNLDLKASAYELDAQQGRLRQARARPNPEIGLLVENAFGTGHHSSFNAAETTLSLGFAIERGARERRGALAEAGVALVTTEISIQRLDRYRIEIERLTGAALGVRLPQ